MGDFPFLVQIVKVCPAYFGEAWYDLATLGFGCKTAEEAVAEAARVVARYQANELPVNCHGGVKKTATFRADFRLACDVCKVTGKKPGCKRMACEACNGLGSVAADFGA